MGLEQLLRRLRLRPLPVSRETAIEIAIAHVSASGRHVRPDAPRAVRQGLGWTVWMTPPARAQVVLTEAPAPLLGPPVLSIDGNTGRVVVRGWIPQGQGAGEPWQQGGSV